MNKSLKLSILALASLVSVVVFSNIPNETPQPTLGTELPSGTAVFETSLAAPITSSATSMTLVANSVRGGGSVAGYQCFTIDEGSSQAEYVCGTITGTSVTSLERGISPADGITEDTDLQFAHRRGSNVKITDFPLIQRLKLQNNGEGSFENAISYATGVTPSGNNHLTDVEYVLSVVNGGTVSFDRQIVKAVAGATVAAGDLVYFDATDNEWKLTDADTATTVHRVLLGIAQGAGTDGNAITNGVLISGLDDNQSGLSQGDILYASNTAGGITTSAGTNSRVIGIAYDTDEFYFAPNYFTNPIDTTLDYTWSGTTVLSGTTTISGNLTISGDLTVSGTVDNPVVEKFTSSGTWTKDANLKYVVVEVVGGGGGGGDGHDNGTTDSAGGGGGGGGYSRELIPASSLSATETVTVGAAGAASAGSSGSASGGNGGTTSFGAHLQATGGTGGNGGNGSPAGKGGAGGVGSGGDVNVNGQAGQGGGGSNNIAGGTGGSSFFGGGGVGGASGSNAGSAGGAYGGGGGGGGGNMSSAAAGGAGAAGVVIVTEYYK